MRFYNFHTHRKPQIAEESVIRNAYHRLTLPQLQMLPYPVSVGIHPWHLHDNLNAELNHLEEILSAPNVLALGEIGPDELHKMHPILRKIALETQIQFAKKRNLPIILHCVKAYYEMIPYLKRFSMPFLFHQFNGNEQQARELLKYNVYLSFGKLLWKPKMEELVQKIPLSRIALETDVAPLSIQAVYSRMAEIRGISVAELSEQIELNFRMFSGKDSLF